MDYKYWGFLNFTGSLNQSMEWAEVRDTIEEFEGSWYGIVASYWDSIYTDY